MTENQINKSVKIVDTLTYVDAKKIGWVPDQIITNDGLNSCLKQREYTIRVDSNGQSWIKTKRGWAFPDPVDPGEISLWLFFKEHQKMGGDKNVIFSRLSLPPSEYYISNEKIIKKKRIPMGWNARPEVSLEKQAGWR